MLPPRTSSNMEADKRISRSELYGESTNPQLDQDKLKEALKREEAFQKKARKEAALDDRKRSYNSMSNVDVSAEDMEAYRLKKARGDDPMAKFLDNPDED